jgi:hypothetical protein
VGKRYRLIRVVGTNPKPFSDPRYLWNGKSAA